MKTVGEYFKTVAAILGVAAVIYQAGVVIGGKAEGAELSEVKSHLAAMDARLDGLEKKIDRLLDRL